MERDRRIQELSLTVTVLVFTLLWFPATVLSSPVKESRLTPERRTELELRGWTAEEIRISDAIFCLYGLDYEDVKTGRIPKRPWIELIHELKQRLASGDAGGYEWPKYSTLTVRDAELLLQKGYDRDTIIVADLLAKRFGWHIEEILVGRTDFDDWDGLIIAMAKLENRPYDKEKAEAAWVKQIRGELKSKPTEQELADMAALGFSTRDVRAADLLAEYYHRPLSLLAALKSTAISWDDVRGVLKRTVH